MDARVVVGGKPEPLDVLERTVEHPDSSPIASRVLRLRWLRALLLIFVPRLPVSPHNAASLLLRALPVLHLRDGSPADGLHLSKHPPRGRPRAHGGGLGVVARHHAAQASRRRPAPARARLRRRPPSPPRSVTDPRQSHGRCRPLAGCGSRHPGLDARLAARLDGCCGRLCNAPFRGAGSGRRKGRYNCRNEEPGVGARTNEAADRVFRILCLYQLVGVVSNSSATGDVCRGAAQAFV